MLRVELMEKEKELPPDPSVEKDAGQPWRHFSRWHFIVLAAVIVFFGAIRWRLLDMPLERDEGEYAYVGQLILQGIPPYQLAYNMKLPGTYATYAAILAVFGQTSRGIHLGLLLVNAVSVVLLYVVAARLFGKAAGTIAGASYALLSTHQSVLGFAAHASHFVVLAALIGLILLLQAEETNRTAFFFWSGLAFGIAFLMKQPGILLAAFALLHLAIQCWPKSKREWGPWAKKMGTFLLAGTLPFVLTCALLYQAGVFQKFWFWTFSYALQYATALPLRTGLKSLGNSFYHIRGAAPGLWALALLGLYSLFRNATARRHAVFVFGFFVFSFAAVCPGLYFREHYFILLMPALAILIAVAVTCAIQFLATEFTSRWPQAIPVLVFAAAWVLAIQHNADFYFKVTPDQACQSWYPKEPFQEAAPIAKYLRQHTAPTDTIMVFGSEPEIYFYAHRHSASGFIYTYSLVADQAYWPAMQKQMMQEVEANRPAYVVLVNLWGSWNARTGSPQAVAVGAWMEQYIANGFEEARMVELAEPGSRYSSREIRIFKRKG